MLECRGCGVGQARSMLRRRSVRINLEGLEPRAILSGSTTDHARTVGPLTETAARPGVRNPAIFTALTGTLQARVTNGPLAGLAARQIGGNAFVVRISRMVANFDHVIGGRSWPITPRLIRLINLQGSCR